MPPTSTIGTVGDDRSQVDLDAIPLRPPFDRRRFALAASAAIALGVFIVSLPFVDFSFGELVDGWSAAMRLIARMFPIQFGDVGEITRLALETVFMAVIGTLLAVILSIPLGFLAARNTAPAGWIAGVARALIVGARTIPDLVFAAIFVRMFGIGVLAGVLALGLHSIGMLGKLFSQVIEEINEGPREAVAATGASETQVRFAAIIPQILPAVIGVSLYRLDINLRTSTVLGYVGAGGIGIALRASLGSLRYDQALGIILFIVILVVGVEALSSAVRRSILSEGADRDSHVEGLLARSARLLGRISERRPSSQTEVLAFDRERLVPPWTPLRRRRAVLTGILALLVVVSFVVVRLNPWELVVAFPKIAAILARFFPPDFATNFSGLIESLAETVAIGVVATVVGIALAIPIAFAMARNVTPARWLYAISRYFVVAFRSVPELIVAVIFVAAVGLGPFAGALALSLGTIGFAAKLFADSLEEVAAGPREALKSTGAGGVQERVAAVVPQALPMFVGTSLYVLDINIRSATVLGIVGAGGVGFMLIQAIRTLEFQRVAAVLIAIFIVVWLIERFAVYIRRRII